MDFKLNKRLLPINKAIKIRWRLVIAAVLIVLPLSLLLFRDHSLNVEAGWWNEMWYYRQAITVTNNSGSTLTDFQVKILNNYDLSSLISAGKLQSDLDDLRFTDGQGKILSYWIEDSTSTSTDVWIKMPTIPKGSSTVYMYYGNPLAESQSNGNEVFEFFDDFNDGKIGSNWTIYGTAGTWTESNGVLQVEGGNNKDAIDAQISLSDNFVMGSRTRVISSSIADMCPSVSKRYKFNYADNYNNSTNLYRYNSDYDKDSSGRTNVQAGLINPTLVQNQWYRHKIIRSGSSIIAYIDGIKSFDVTDDNYHDPHIGFWTFGGVTMQIDWVFVRKYIASDPTVGAPASEEQGPGPIAYWSFDEGYGSTAYDYSPNNNDATITGATWKSASECKFGKCLYFDGIGDYAAASLDLSQTNVVTISFWAKWIDFVNDGSILMEFSENYNSYTDSFLILPNNSNGLFHVSVRGNGGYNTADFERTEANEWHFYTFVFNKSNPAATEVIPYMDGKALSYIKNYNAENSNNFGNRILYFMSRGGTTNYAKGYIDEVKIYNYARTAEQIKQDYNRGKVVMLGQSGGDEYASLNDGLVGWWKMDEVDYSSGAVQDYSGLGNVMSKIGTVVASSTAKFGRAADFAADSDYLCTDKDGDNICDYTNGINYGTNNFSISFWMKTNNTGYQRIASHYGGSGYVINKDSDSINFYINDGTTVLGYTPVITGITPHDGNWHLATLVIDRQKKEVRGYWDGQYKNKMDISTITESISPTAAYVLGYYGAFTDDYTGLFDDWRVYNRALSPEEVRRLYEWAPGPVFYMDFNENSGISQVYDKSGNNNHGTMNGGMTETDWVSGKYGGALEFDGENDYINVSHSDILDQDSHNFTQTAWIWIDPQASNFNGLNFGKYNYNGSVYQGYGIWGSGATGLAYTLNDIDSGIDYQVLESSLPTGKWLHIATVIDRQNNELRYYRNGILIKTIDISAVDGSVSNSSASLRIGYEYYAANRYTMGKIDEVKIYNYARTHQQILEDMSAGRKNNPLAYWSFDEGQGATAYDRGIVKQVTGTGYDGILTNISTSGTSTAWTKYGKVGGALKFDGVDDYISIGTDGDFIFQEGNQWSIGLWFKTSDSYTGYNTGTKLIGKGTGGAIPGYSINIGNMSNTDCDNKFGFTVDASPGNNYTKCSAISPSVNDGQWHYGVIVFDAKDGISKIRGRIYLDGVDYGFIDSTVDKSGWVTTNSRKLQIGWSYGTAYAFRGEIDEVKIYNYALTLDEVRQNYNQGKQTVLSKSKEEVQATTEGLVGWWKMDENSWYGNTGEVIDYSGVGNHGTAKNSLNSTSTAKYGRAGEFDGVDDYVFVGDLDYINTGKNNEFTVSMWIYPRSTSGYQFIFGDEVSFNRGVMIQLNSGQICDFYPFAYKCSGYYPTLNKWVYITLRQDSNGVDFYVNGKFYSHIMDYLHEDTNYNSYIGMWYDGYGRPFNGLIDDVKVYNYARSPEQIMRDYLDGPPSVAYWKFDDFSGTAAVDSSGMGNDGTINSATWEVRGKKGGALKFDGDGDYVTSLNNIDISGNKPRTVSLWFKQVIQANKNLIGFGANADLQLFDFLLYNGKLVGHFYGGGNDTITGAPSYNLNEWNHAVITYDGTIVKVYLNGKYANSKVISLNTTNSTVTIGGGKYSPYNYFRGLIDEVKIYDYALTPRQVAMEYNGGAPVGYWKFDESEGETAYDYSGNGNNGTVYIGSGGSQTSTSTAWSNGSAGKINGSLNFDGTDDWVNIPASSKYNFKAGQGFSYGAWAKANSISGSQKLIIDRTTNTTPLINILTNTDGTVICRFRDTAGNIPSATSQKTISTGIWYHYICVQDPGSDKVKLYVNGELWAEAEDTTVADVNLSSVQLRIGSHANGGSYTWNGQIDEVKIWNYALTPEEVKREYNGGFGTYFK